MHLPTILVELKQNDSVFGTNVLAQLLMSAITDLVAGAIAAILIDF